MSYVSDWVSIGGGATQLFSLSSPGEVVLYNLGPGTAYLGSGSMVAPNQSNSNHADAGLPLHVGERLTLNATASNPLYALCVDDQATVVVLK